MSWFSKKAAPQADGGLTPDDGLAFLFGTPRPAATAAMASQGIVRRPETAETPRAEGVFMAQMAAMDLIMRYRSGDLADGMQSIVERFVGETRARGDDAQGFIDETVNLAVDRWNSARRTGNSDDEAMSMAVAASALAGYMLATS